MSSPPRARSASRSVTKTATSPDRPATSGSGSAGCLRPILALAFVAAIAVAISILNITSWQRIDADGRSMRCKVQQKDERIDKRSRSDSWSIRFRVTLECPYTPEAPMFPWFETDEQEFDRLRIGDPLDMRYGAVPLGYQFLGVSPSHLARETSATRTAQIIAKFWPLVPVAAYLSVLGILIWIVVKLRVPGARWALAIVGFIGVVWLLTPTLPVTVSGKTLPATATIKEIYTFTTLLDSDRSDGIPAITPYELVVLQYLPAGRTTPVTTADMIDISSHKGLTAGQTVAIEYEAAHPRRANIQQATRFYYWKNVEGAFVMAVLSIGFLVGGSLLWDFLKKQSKQALADARERAKDQAMLEGKPYRGDLSDPRNLRDWFKQRLDEKGIKPPGSSKDDKPPR
jgi:hypothetical protein